MQGVAPPAGEPMDFDARWRRLDAVLPQTQCQRCGEPDCAGYAQALARGALDINRCPPGGAEGIVRLAALTGRAFQPLDPACGEEGPWRPVRIDEAWCIGCTLCIAACPVDCIVGAAKQMHTVIAADCTGCGLCLPACPVDCIDWEPGPAGAPQGGAAWTPAQAEAARAAYAATRVRRQRQRQRQEDRQAQRARDKLQGLAADPRLASPGAVERKRAAIEAALARARAAREAAGPEGA